VLRQLGVFRSVVVVAFHSVFHLEMHQNIFLFFKNHFDISVSKRSENTKKHINLKQRKKLKKIQFFSKIFLKCKNKQDLSSFV
jgi:hypothetical protein